MKSLGPKRYRLHEFARLAGVTVRALHEYDRVGLLKPTGRSGSGYRLYSGKDFATLKQIVALRFFGFTLEEIRRLITGANLSVAQVLLEQKQEQLGHVIQAIRDAQKSPVENQKANFYQISQIGADFLATD